MYVAFEGKKIVHYQNGYKFPRSNLKTASENLLPFLEQLKGRTVEESLVSEERDLSNRYDCSVSLLLP